MNSSPLRGFHPPHIGMRIIKTAIAVLICLLIYYFRGYRGLSMPSEAALTAIVCMQPYMRDARDYALNRLAGSLIGSVWGLLFLLLMLLFPFLGQSLPLVYVLMAVGVLLSLYTSVLVRMPDSSCLAAIVFICVVIAFPEIEQPLFQAVQRITGVLLGTLVAVGVNIFRLPRAKNRDTVFFVRTRDLVPDRFSHIPSAALFRLNRLYGDGAKICLMSEHAPAFFTLQMNEAMLSVPLIVMDGAAIFDPRENEYLDTVTLPPKASAWLRAELERLRLPYFIYTVHRGRTCIFHAGEMNGQEKLVYERMRSSPYRSYLDGESFLPEEIVYLKLISESDKIAVLEKRLRTALSVHGLRAAVREQAGVPGLAGLYLYARDATMENAAARLLARLRQDNAALSGQSVALQAPYRSEHDAMVLLHRLESAYEPLWLFRKKREEASR